MKENFILLQCIQVYSSVFIFSGFLAFRENARNFRTLGTIPPRPACTLHLLKLPHYLFFGTIQRF